MGARDCFILHILFHSVLFDLHMLNKFSSWYALTLLRLGGWITYLKLRTYIASGSTFLLESDH